MFFTKCVYKSYFHHTMCESTCDTLTSSSANQGDNTVSVAQSSQKKKKRAQAHLKMFFTKCVYKSYMFNIYCHVIAHEDEEVRMILSPLLN